MGDDKPVAQAQCVVEGTSFIAGKFKPPFALNAAPSLSSWTLSAGGVTLMRVPSRERQSEIDTQLT